MIGIVQSTNFKHNALNRLCRLISYKHPCTLYLIAVQYNSYIENILCSARSNGTPTPSL